MDSRGEEKLSQSFEPFTAIFGMNPTGGVIDLDMVEWLGGWMVGWKPNSTIELSEGGAMDGETPIRRYVVSFDGVSGEVR